MTSLSFSAFVKPEHSHYEQIKKSLENILNLAEGFGQQACRAQRILLSLYAPDCYQMSGNDFTGLDIPHIHHAINILHEHGMCRKDIFSLVEHSEERIIQLSKHIQPIAAKAA